MVSRPASDHRRSGSHLRRFAATADKKAGHYQKQPIANQLLDYPIIQLPNHSTRMRSDRVMMNVLSVLKSLTRTAGFCSVIIVCSRSTGVETSTNGNAGCMIVSTGCDLTLGLRTS